MSSPFRYQLGDLVEFTAKRATEEYIAETKLAGIVIKQRFVFTADNKFLVRTPHAEYWIGSDKITLISKAEKI
tara:strand:- start:1715 stop:1933 length:219 start_codon:yes stop_codon:yes gene_type:complete